MKNKTGNSKQSSHRHRPKKTTKRGSFVTKRQINRIIDILLHPRFSQKPELRIVNGLLHALVEQDLKISMEKFVRYNILPLLTQKQPRRKKRKRRQLQA